MPTDERVEVTEAHRVKWEAWIDALQDDWPDGPNSNLAHWELVDIAGPQLIARCEAAEARVQELEGTDWYSRINDAFESRCLEMDTDKAELRRECDAARTELAELRAAKADQLDTIVKGTGEGRGLDHLAMDPEEFIPWLRRIPVVERLVDDLAQRTAEVKQLRASHITTTEERDEWARKAMDRQAEVAALREALDRDRTGLADALNAVRTRLAGASWLGEDDVWASYEEDEQTIATLRQEIRGLFDVVHRVCTDALRESGTRATKAIQALAATTPMGEGKR